MSYVGEKGIEIIKSKVEHTECKRGIKPVQKALQRAQHGLVILAHDTTPFDIVSHIPALCKERGVPLRYIRSRFDILTSKSNPVTCLFIPESVLTNEEAQEIEREQNK